ncbi:MAG: DHH family phosphoesterase [Planctomycetota bacterium]
MPPPADDQEKARRLVELLKNARRIAVVTHDNPDPDALGAAFGIRAIAERQAGKPAAIVYGGLIGRSENRAMVSRLGIEITPAAEARWADFDAFVLVDTQPDVRNHSLPPGAPVVAVLDHHPVFRRSQASIPLFDVRKDCGATTTIVLAYLRALEIGIEGKLATALFYGLATDTRNLNRMAHPIDAEAFLHLFPLIDLDALQDITRPRVPRAYFSLYKGAIERAVLRGDAIHTWLGTVSSPDTVSEIAEFLIRLEDCTWSVAGGAHGSHLFLSLRSGDPAQDTGRLLKEVIGKDGSAGGHGAMAGARIALPSGNPADADEAWRRFCKRFFRALGRSSESETPLIG